jgi:hypothetical protein
MLNLPGFSLGGERLEGTEEVADVLLRGDENEHVLDAPALVIHAFMVRGLERIAAQVEQLRQPQRDERLLPDVEAVPPLLGEHDLPLVVAEADERAVVIEVEELVALARGFPGERRRAEPNQCCSTVIPNVAPL